MEIYYEIGENDLYNVVNNYLNRVNAKDLKDHLLIYLLAKSPFEFFSEIQQFFQKWINFSFLDIFYDLNLIPNEKELDGKTLREKLYLDFIEYLMYLEVPLTDFLNYTSLFDIERGNRKIYYVLLERFSIKYVKKELNIYSKLELNLNIFE